MTHTCGLAFTPHSVVSRRVGVSTGSSVLRSSPSPPSLESTGLASTLSPDSPNPALPLHFQCPPYWEDTFAPHCLCLQDPAEASGPPGLLASMEASSLLAGAAEGCRERECLYLATTKGFPLRQTKERHSRAETSQNFKLSASRGSPRARSGELVSSLVLEAGSW